MSAHLCLYILFSNLILSISNPTIARNYCHMLVGRSLLTLTRLETRLEQHCTRRTDPRTDVTPGHGYKGSPLVTFAPLSINRNASWASDAMQFQILGTVYYNLLGTPFIFGSGFKTCAPPFAFDSIASNCELDSRSPNIPDTTGIYQGSASRFCLSCRLGTVFIGIIALD